MYYIYVSFQPKSQRYGAKYLASQSQTGGDALSFFTVYPIEQSTFKEYQFKDNAISGPRRSLRHGIRYANFCVYPIHFLFLVVIDIMQFKYQEDCSLKVVPKCIYYYYILILQHYSTVRIYSIQQLIIPTIPCYLGF